MYVVGVIEMMVGLAILTRWTLVGSYVAMVWLVAIAANLLTTGKYFDIAVRDLAMAVAAYTLAVLTKELAAPANSLEHAGLTSKESQRAA
jgi:hypothetical protein